MTLYIKRFLKNRFCLAFGSATLLDLLFLIPDLIYDKAIEDPMIYIGCYLLALIWFLLDIGYTLYFRRLIILKIYANDGKLYTHRFSSRSNAQKIRQWFKAGPPSSP